MVRVLFLAILFATLNAQNLSPLDEKIINLIGEADYNRNKSFINKIFAPQSNFYQGGNLDIYQVISLLQNNGLLKLKFASPREFSAVFVAQSSPLLLLKTINQSLSYMGYSYFIPSEADYESEVSKIRISLNTEHIIDPIILLNELQKSGFVAVNVNRISQNEWEYHLNLADSKIQNATFLAKGNNLNIIEVSGQYWLEVGSLGRLEVKSIANKSFAPKIVFFDRNLNILDIQQLSRRRDFNISIIENTKFVKISDLAPNSNLKAGLNVRLR
ncbi:hypothetical protein [Helicobacter sp. 23-1045]